MSSSSLSAALARARSRRAARGATLLEYLILTVFVAVPCFAAALACFVQLALWYTRFINTVSQSTP